MYRKLLATVVGIVASLGLTAALTWAAPEIGKDFGRSASNLVGAPESVTVTETKHLTDTEHITGTGQAKIVDAIAKRFGVTPTDVVSIAGQGLGWGEVFKVFQLAKASGKSTSQILAMHAGSTQDWREIAKSLGVKPGQGKDNLGQALKALKDHGRPANNGDNGNKEDKRRNDKSKEPSVRPTRPPDANPSQGDDGKPKGKKKK